MGIDISLKVKTFRALNDVSEEGTVVFFFFFFSCEFFFSILCQMLELAEIFYQVILTNCG